MKFPFTNEQTAAFGLLGLPVTATPVEIMHAYMSKKNDKYDVNAPLWAARGIADDCYHKQQQFKHDKLAKQQNLLPRYPAINEKYRAPLRNPETTKEALEEFFGDVNNDIRFLDVYPLQIAVQYNNIPVVKLLLELGADVNCPQDKPNYTPIPIMQAVLNQNIEMVELLCEQPEIFLPDTLLPAGHGSKLATLLNKAIELGDITIVQTLLRHQMKVNLPEDIICPLTTALLARRYDIAHILIAAGANIKETETQLDVTKRGMVVKAIYDEIDYIKDANMFETTIISKNTHLKNRYSDVVTDEMTWRTIIFAKPGLTIQSLLSRPRPPGQRELWAHIMGILQINEALNFLVKREMEARDQSTDFLKLQGLITIIVTSVMHPPRSVMLKHNQAEKMELLYAITKKMASLDDIKSALIKYIAAVDGFLNKTDKHHLKSTLAHYLGNPFLKGRNEIMDELTLANLPASETSALSDLQNPGTTASHARMFGTGNKAVVKTGNVSPEPLNNPMNNI